MMNTQEVYLFIQPADPGKCAENCNCIPGRLVFRMPLIPGFNDGDENINATADFIV